MNRNRKNDAVKQNKAIKHSAGSATVDALKAAENKEPNSKNQ
jgi:hypothetical protein